MTLDIVSIGEALVEIMRTELDQPLDRPAGLTGPYPSGAPAIFADAAQRLGSKVGFVGVIGHDAFGNCIYNRLEQDGLDCSGLKHMNSLLTGIAFVSYRSDGSRSFVYHLSGSAAAAVQYEHIPVSYHTARHIHIMGSSLTFSDSMREACYKLARDIYQAGGSVSLDPNLRPELMDPEKIRDICEPILSLCRVVFPSGTEATMLTGANTPEEAAQTLLDKGIEIVALKEGEGGSRIFTREGVLHVSPYSVIEVDPTGAGDCYDAAFMTGLLQNWPLDKVGRLANAVGALATSKQGPMEGAPYLQEVMTFMQRQGMPL